MVFVEDHAFARRRRGLLDEDELFAFLEYMALHPEGKIIPGSGGLRKIRWSARGRGKRGGVRVIYFWWINEDQILLLDIYAKGEKENLTAVEISKLKGKVVR